MIPDGLISLLYKDIPSVRPTATLTQSCCSWTPSREIRHGWGTGNRGCWHCRRFPGSTAGHLRRALPCWGSGLRERRNIYISRFTRAEWKNSKSAFWCLPGNVCLLTLVLAVQRVHSSQPHQAHEQDHWPHDLHKETHLVEERYDHSQDLSLQGDPAVDRWAFVEYIAML